MDSRKKNEIYKSIVELLELPDSAYKKAEERYEDIGGWLGREESVCARHDPHIFAQGSFRLGTAIRPLDVDGGEMYDLDLACNLRKGISKESHSQQEVKNLLGREIEEYRNARGIKKQIEEKHRCWRLEYADKLSFHMDIVPCIPADKTRVLIINESVMKSGVLTETLAKNVSELTLSITDDRHPDYRTICDNWGITNPQGYARWFESRMKLAQQVINERIFEAKAEIDDLPAYQWKTPLQRCVQLLKRHRDQIYKDRPDVKPISIIITTLAARAYQGEADIDSALKNILSRMGELVSPYNPRVPNPVDPEEDFADRWLMSKYAHLNLEQNFWNWLTQAQVDFDLLVSTDDMDFISEQAKKKIAVNIAPSSLRMKLGLPAVSILTSPKTHTITPKESPRPWRKG